MTIQKSMVKEMGTADVQASARPLADGPTTLAQMRRSHGGYLLLSETDIRAAKGSWDALKGLSGTSM